ncbi:MAG: integral rane sensor signal transduction histidine kinase [Hyphomicrobiales bacterium]|nr:integral rane sensor signal transduction histidine kinase [Hyphomicrobiales bacterium]
MAEKAKVQFLAGMPTKDVLQRLSELDKRAIVFTPGYFRDGEGRDSVPKEIIDLMAQTAHAPIYVPFDTFLGTGVVGGHMASFQQVGNYGAKIVARLFARADAQGLDLPAFMPTQLHVDWRQLARWDIDPAALPANTVEHFRQPGYWEEHYKEVLIALTIVAFQAALISLLLLERHRRHRTQAALQKNRFELAHASRLAIAGELTGSITHEISQPLGAILSNAAAAELMLQSGAHDTNALLDILQDIQRDDIRASQVMRRLRALLQKHEVDHEIIDLNEVLSDVAEMLRAEALRRNVALTVSLAQVPASIKGDRVQIQQVLINLVLNALDSVMELAPVRRQIQVGMAFSETTITVEVQDRGTGIPPENVTHVFDSFFTTKAEGIGLGLSIVRTIVEAHGGTIGVRNLKPHGALFHIDLPRMQHKATAERVA